MVLEGLRFSLRVFLLDVGDRPHDNSQPPKPTDRPRGSGQPPKATDRPHGNGQPPNPSECRTTPRERGLKM
jgi:hypothetical protein